MNTQLPKAEQADSDSLKEYQEYIRKDFKITRLSSDLFGFELAKKLVDEIIVNSYFHLDTLIDFLKGYQNEIEHLKLTTRECWRELYQLLHPMTYGNSLWLCPEGFEACRDLAFKTEPFRVKNAIPPRVQVNLVNELLDKLGLQKELVLGDRPKQLMITFGVSGPSYYVYFLECLKQRPEFKCYISALEANIKRIRYHTTIHRTHSKRFKPKPDLKSRPKPIVEDSALKSSKPEPKPEPKPGFITEKTGQTLLFDKPSSISINGDEVDLVSFLLMLSGHPHLSKVEKDSAMNLARACTLRQIDINHLGRK